MFSTKVEDIKKIAVIGAGVMGSGIAEICARNGCHITMVDESDEILKKSFDRINNSLDKSLEAGKISPEEAHAALIRIRQTTDLYEAVKDSDLVIEAITEDLELKRRVFKQLDEYCPPHTVLASTTSSLMITSIATTTKRPDKVIGMHFFQPTVMRLVEIIRGALTSDETFQLTWNFSLELGRVNTVAIDSPGFVSTRLGFVLYLEAIRCVENGLANINDIDTMCKQGHGHAMGPIECVDFIGLDTVLRVSEYMFRETGNHSFAPPLLLKKLVQAGYIGDQRKKPGSKGGFYEFFKVAHR